VDDQAEKCRADVIVVVAVSDANRGARLATELASRHCEVAVATCIAAIADVAVDDRSVVAIVDGASSEWLRECSDLLRRRPTVLLLALMEPEAPGELLAAVSAGIGGFVTPDASAEAIARTVRALIDTGVAIPRGLIPSLVDEVRRGRGRSVSTALGPVDVTDREWEILQLLLQRRSTREIAELLFVSVGTVRSHVSALGRKLGAVDREDTIRLLEQRRG
jgi:DNA-binding NarL/FixJ family response regulator